MSATTAEIARDLVVAAVQGNEYNGEEIAEMYKTVYAAVKEAARIKASQPNG
ncbi:hypothetical protein [Stenotrophomonas maltophilia]|uniref:hypothetical protein n=1 Tax=Stenotrophomonas maltophilia TaxID=40324 RepID=UPI0012FD1571|nr:hypothetical protein [Stenotrophomonas maltophilia]MBN5118406.1 hypothetical protein [Stenotrophomonas maltophilia]